MTITLPEKNLPTIAIVGRTNVGKSTLFNRLIENRKALVSPIAGTTRTNNISTFFWRGQETLLIDTGGLDFIKGDLLEKEILRQIERALKESGVIIFLIDLKENILPQDKEWARMLKKIKTPIVLAGNKADNQKIREKSRDKEWLKLGFGEPQPISSVNGSGIGDLLDEAIKKLKTTENRHVEKIEPLARVAIIGRPNVGKSTLFNALIGEERVITSSIAHTTRESYDTLIIKDEKAFLFVDTAGIRRKANVKRGIESGGVGQAIESVAKSDLSLLVLDAGEPFTTQDKHLIQMISSKKKGLIVIVNKWDLVTDKDTDTQVILKRQLFELFPPLSFAPVLFVSALTHKNVDDIYEQIEKATRNSRQIIDEKILTEFMKNSVRQHLPTVGRGVRHPYLYSFKQVDINPPTFEITIKQKTSLHESYLKFMENNLRREFDFSGTPVVVYVKKIKI